MEQIRKNVLAQLDMTREQEEQELLAVIDEEICREAKERMIPLNWRRELRTQVFHSLRKLDVLQELLSQDDITEIMVNGADHIFYEKRGEILTWDKSFSSREKLEDIIQQMVGSHNRVVNQAEPIADTRLSDGSRVNVVLPPVALEGPVVSIRKFPKHPILMEQMIAGGSISRECADFLKILVRAGYNIFISGGTGSGKTTFLNALSEFIPKTERIITIEDSAELQIQGIPNLVRMETRSVHADGRLSISIRDLIRTALRMRPDRIIVGEIRGAECLDMLQAMNTGHDGSLSTGHANSCRDMVSRMETMVLMGMELPLQAIRAQISAGVDILVHLGRLRDRSRKLLAIMEIDGMENGAIRLNPLYEFVEMGEGNGRIVGTWMKQKALIHRGKLYAAGLEWEENDIERT